MKEFKNMLQALSAAQPICEDWIVMGSNEYVDYETARQRAKDLDEKCDLTYICSEEGAIGIMRDYEYMTQWILLPVGVPTEAQFNKAKALLNHTKNTELSEQPGFFAQLKGAIKDVFSHPVRLLPTIVLAVAWVLLSMMWARLSETPLWLKIASYFTFAQGGMFGGIISAAGGIFGKILVAAFLNAMILPLFKKKPPFSGVSGGLKGLFSQTAIDGIRSLSPLFMGIGFALLLYGFMNSRESLAESFVGIVVVVMLLDNIGKKSGLLTAAVFGVAKVFTGGKMPSQLTVTRCLSGLTMGFALAVALSFSPIRICVALGILFVLIALVCRLFPAKQPRD